MMKHDVKVGRIAELLKNRTSTAPVALKKKSVSHKVPNPHDVKHGDSKIDISDLNEILEIDAEKMICVAEPGVTFTDLVTATLKHGLVPMLVPELKTITIGGAVSGCSVESTSYKFGGFHDNCLEYELISAKGDVLNCTSCNGNRDLFNMAHGSFGTLGILSKLTFKLMKAKPFVRMQYVTYKSYDAYKEAIWQHYVDRDVDFMDGIIHSRREYVLCLGSFTDRAPYTSSYEWMNIYYKSTRHRKTDYLTTHDYYFRYDTDAHWLAGKYGLENPLLRFLFGRQLLTSTKMLETAARIQSALKYVKPDVVVDVFVPFSNLDRFFEFYMKEFKYFPIWIVPMKIDPMYDWMNPEFVKGTDGDLYIDVAIYGMKQGNRNCYKMLEDILMEVKGVKTLISYNYYDEKTFWSIFNKDNYDSAKARVDPDNIFRDLYGKTHFKTD